MPEQHCAASNNAITYHPLRQSVPVNQHQPETNRAQTGIDMEDFPVGDFNEHIMQVFTLLVFVGTANKTLGDNK